MPHFHIEYSANLQEHMNMGGLCEAVRQEASEIEAFPLAGIRVRAICVDHYAIADGNAQHGFIDLSIRLRAGRSRDIKQDAVERIFAVIKRFCDTALATHSIALSAEIRDIDAGLSPKFGTIRDHMTDTHMGALS